MNGIEVFDPIDKSTLSQKEYFSSLMSQAVDNSLVSQIQSEKIQGEIFDILRELCFSIVERGHSSISAETAQDIVKSIMYCIGLKLKEFEKPKAAVEYVLENKLLDIYYQGREIISKRIEEIKNKTQLIKSNMFQTESIFYNAAIEKEVADFLKFYDPKYAADKDETILSYAVYIQNNELCGVEKISDYVEKFYNENKFLLLFNKNDVHHLLTAVDMNGETNIYKELPVNIFEYVLYSALGLVLLGKSPLNLDLTKNDVKKIEEIFFQKSETEIFSILNEALANLVYLLAIDKETEAYLLSTVEKLEYTLKNSKNLSSLFLVPLYPEFSQPIFAQDFEQMPTVEFRAIVDMLKASDTLRRKVEIISESIESQRDFDDLIYAVPLNCDEIFWSLKRLNPTIALLMYVQYKNEYEGAAKEAIEKYVSELSKPRQELIKELALKISNGN